MARFGFDMRARKDPLPEMDPIMSSFDNGTKVHRIRMSDGVMLHAEEVGSGPPIVFVHEFAGDTRAWEAQVRAFARSNRCISYNARGYPPSDVPTDVEAYSQARAADDIADVIRRFGLDRAHVVGCSMGAFATLHLAIRNPGLMLSAVLAGIGYGAPLDRLEQFRAEALSTADLFLSKGIAEVAKNYTLGPARVQFQNRDPRGWAEAASHFASHDSLGAYLTMRGVQARRPSIYNLQAEIAVIDVPTLVVVGDEDDPALDASLYLKRTMPRAGMVTFARAGHAVNEEEPARFNQEVADFHRMVAMGAWGKRDPRSLRKSALGMKD